MQGVGVALYLRVGIRFKILHASKISNLNETEFLLLEVILENNERLLIATVYRRSKNHVLS